MQYHMLIIFGAYIVKYMTKDNTDIRLQRLKAYQFSKNLKRPEEIVNHNLPDFDKIEKRIEDKYKLTSFKPVYESNYDTEILGSCYYKQFNLNRGENNAR